MWEELVAGTLLALAGGIGKWIVAAYVLGRSRPHRERAQLRGGSLVGTLATVALPIPVGGVGTVAHHASGRRSAIPAIHVDGARAEEGVEVVIVEIRGPLAVVLPLHGLEEEGVIR